MVQEIALLFLTSLAFALGFTWLGQPPLLGYIVAGVLLGPSFVKLIEYPVVISVLGEFGMLTLLFVVGLELDVREFKKVWHIAFGTIILQAACAFPVAYFLKFFLVWTDEITVLVAFLLMLSSTAVAVTLLEEIGELKSSKGSLTVSILIAQDLILVPMMLILRGFSGDTMIQDMLIKLILASGFLVFLIAYLTKESNKYILSPLKYLFQGSSEMLTLGGVSVCFCFGAFSALLGLSGAYGSFLGGLILGNIGNRKEIIQVALPISSLLVMMFFLSVGSTMDISYIMEHWLIILFALFALTIGKTFCNYYILKILGCPSEKAGFVAMMLAQCTEFSFALIAILFESNCMSADMQNMLKALVVLSLTLGSVWPILCRQLVWKLFNKVW